MVEFVGDVKRSVRKVVAASEVVGAMAKRGHSTPDCKCVGHLVGWTQGGRGGSRTGAEGENPGERWFQQENFAEETKALMRLEGELNVTLLFEHGGHQLGSLLWIACILLSRLFREHVSLGWTVKVFPKHYRKEVMHGLVKLQGLLDFAEPPLGGLLAATSAGQRCSEDMELDMEEEDQEQNS